MIWITSALLASCGASGSAVWWSSELNLVSLAQLSARRRQPFEEALEVSSADAGAPPATMRDCLSYSELRARGYAPLDNQSLALMKHDAAVCRTLELLASAKAPSDARLEGFLASRELASKLPAALGPQVSPVDAERRTKATAAGVPWGALSPGLVVEAQATTSARLTDADAHTQIDLLATADFDADGREDALLKTTSHGDQGNWSEIKLWLLGQSDAGPLRIIRELDL